MIENEKARSDAATPEQANERASTDAAFINQSNIKRRGVQAFLLEGEANALPMRELARLVGVSERQARKIIERERRNGSMILSSDNGYFLPSPDCERYEIRRYIHRADARMVTNRKTIRAMKDRLKELEAQENGQEILEL
mgnify:FL=1